VAAILDLEQLLVDWAADTNISDETERARTMLRRMVFAARRAGRDRCARSPVGPGAVRRGAAARTRRGPGREGLRRSDRLRDQLVAAGVEVHDTPDGAAWELRP